MTPSDALANNAWVVWEEPAPGLDHDGTEVTCAQTLRMRAKDAVHVSRASLRSAGHGLLHNELLLLTEFQTLHWAWFEQAV